MLFHRAPISLNLLKTTSNRFISSSTASITRIHRQTYAQTYPTILVYPDGSSITIRYHEPTKIIRMPLDLTTLSEAERKARLERRKPKQKIIVEDEMDMDFNAKKYLKYIKKK